MLTWTHEELFALSCASSLAFHSYVRRGFPKPLWASRETATNQNNHRLKYSQITWIKFLGCVLVNKVVEREMRLTPGTEIHANDIVCCYFKLYLYCPRNGTLHTFSHGHMISYSINICMSRIRSPFDRTTKFHRVCFIRILSLPYRRGRPRSWD